MKRLSLGLVLVAAAAATCAVVRPGRAADDAKECGRSGSCAQCHAGSAPGTHDPGFLSSGHGAAALRDRAACLSCHEEQGCSDCHRARRPAWHGAGFCAPGRGREEREAHARIAGERREGCAECHAAGFARECARCHRADEDWLRPARGGR